MRRQRTPKALRHVLGIALIGLLLPGSASAADLSAGLGRDADRVFVGSVLRYTLTVSNAGPDAATNVRARLSVPREAGMLRASASGGRCLVRRSTAICRVATLEPGASTTFHVLARPIAPGEVTTTGRVSAIGLPDPNPSDNLAEDTARIRVVPGSCTNLRLGTAAAERLDGTTGGDAIFGRRGHDIVGGGLGEDCLSGQEGDDTLRGGDDDDTLFGDTGADLIEGGAGDDLASAGSGADRIEDVEDVRAGPGDDRIVAPPDSFVRCGEGRDFVELTGPAVVEGCEQVVGPPPPPPAEPTPAPPPGGQADDPFPQGRPPPLIRRRRGGRCKRRYCPRGGVPQWVQPSWGHGAGPLPLRGS